MSETPGGPGPEKSDTWTPGAQAEANRGMAEIEDMLKTAAPDKPEADPAVEQAQHEQLKAEKAEDAQELAADARSKIDLALNPPGSPQFARGNGEQSTPSEKPAEEHDWDIREVNNSPVEVFEPNGAELVAGTTGQPVAEVAPPTTSESPAEPSQTAVEKNADDSQATESAPEGAATTEIPKRTPAELIDRAQELRKQFESRNGQPTAEDAQAFTQYAAELGKAGISSEEMRQVVSAMGPDAGRFLITSHVEAGKTGETATPPKTNEEVITEQQDQASAEIADKLESDQSISRQALAEQATASSARLPGERPAEELVNIDLSELDGPAAFTEPSHAERQAGAVTRPTASEQPARQAAALEGPTNFVEPSHAERQAGAAVVDLNSRDEKEDGLDTKPTGPGAPEAEDRYGSPTEQTAKKPRRSLLETIDGVVQEAAGNPQASAETATQPQGAESQPEQAVEAGEEQEPQPEATTETETATPETPEAEAEPAAQAETQSESETPPTPLSPREAENQEFARKILEHAADKSSFVTSLLPGDPDLEQRAGDRRAALGVGQVPFHEEKDYGRGVGKFLRKLFRRKPKFVERHYMNPDNPNFEIMERSDGKTNKLISQRTFTSSQPAGVEGKPAADLAFQISEAKYKDEMLQRGQRTQQSRR